LGSGAGAVAAANEHTGVAARSAMLANRMARAALDPCARRLATSEAFG